MMPSVLTSPSKTLVIGATGGPMITTALVSVGIHDDWDHRQTVAGEGGV